ncbi:MazG nucleotide pyrophosphohydrolase [Stackebrandtia nassauensis DSM 44728]|uniref:MazG nucleotide pyrophosphohydrolase n=2 Tax=Stackebrandtia TaxID=283810 RepID=D3Q561_STANL|nr:MazG nucleotide pyrophosphohydrolase [Stackebrandtia nassauensis DSM 44728]
MRVAARQYSAGMRTIEDLAARLRDFAAERDWEQFHTPKNLAMALAGEAGELVAELQWLTPEESQHLSGEAKAKVADEMADVLHYLVRLADVMEVDLLAASASKIERNARRYPAESHRGSARKAAALPREPS